MVESWPHGGRQVDLGEVAYIIATAPNYTCHQHHINLFQVAPPLLSLLSTSTTPPPHCQYLIVSLYIPFKWNILWCSPCAFYILTL